VHGSEGQRFQDEQVERAPQGVHLLWHVSSGVFFSYLQ
jgi:hypothetical protein